MQELRESEQLQEDDSKGHPLFN